MKETSWMKSASGWRDVEVPYRCRDCPYPGHGFICLGKDGRCMRTEVEKFNRRSRRMRILSRHRKDGKKK